MDLDERIDALYQLDLGAFVAARNALAAELKAEGDKDAAGRVKALAKPSVSAWAVNRASVAARDAFGALIDAGEAVRVAQAGGDGADLAAAMKQRRDALSALMSEARALLADAGRGAGDAIMRRVSTTFEALAAYGRHQPEPGAGRLAADLEPPGFEVLVALAANPPPPRAARPPAAGVSDARPPDDTAGATARARLAAVAQARADLDAATRDLDAVGRRAQAAVEHRDTCIERLAAAESELADAAARLARAQARATEARTTLATAESTATTATQSIAPALDRIHAILATLERS